LKIFFKVKITPYCHAKVAKLKLFLKVASINSYVSIKSFVLKDGMKGQNPGSKFNFKKKDSEVIKVKLKVLNHQGFKYE
jgi:hypothetical protein